MQRAGDRESGYATSDGEFARQLDGLKGFAASEVRRAADQPPEVIEDLTQEVLIRCWEHRDRIRDLRAYIRKAARNAVIDHLRSPEEKLASFEHVSESLGVNAEAVMRGAPWASDEGLSESMEEILEQRAARDAVRLCYRMATERSPRDAALIWGYLQGRKMPEMLPDSTQSARTAAYRRVVRALEWAKDWLIEHGRRPGPECE